MQVGIAHARNKKAKNLKIVKICVFQYSLATPENPTSVQSHWTGIFCVSFSRGGSRGHLREGKF